MMDWSAIHPRFMRYLTNRIATPGEAQADSLASLIFRPVQANDVDLILEMHQRLSDDTLFNRYFSPRVPTKQEITQICQLTGENGRAIVAVVTGKTSAIVGMAYFIVSGKDTAEPALLVEDRYQAQGIGKQLFQELTSLAIVQGICFFDALVLPGNQTMIHLLHNAGLVIQNRLGYGTREMQIQLTAVRPYDRDLNCEQHSAEAVTFVAV